MKKLLAIFLLSASSLLAFPSLDAGNWLCTCHYPWTYFYNIPGGFAFDFPQRDPEYGYGTVGYIRQWTLNPIGYKPAAISITFRVESSPDVEYVSVQVPEIPAQFRLLFMAAYTPGCPTSEVNPIPCEFRSWWAHYDSYVLGSADGKTFTMRVPLDPELWSSVFGRLGSDSDGWFDVAKNSIVQVGFTFGGNFYGHGVRLNAGSSTVKVLDYQIEPESQGTP